MSVPFPKLTFRELDRQTYPNLDPIGVRAEAKGFTLSTYLTVAEAREAAARLTLLADRIEAEEQMKDGVFS